MVSNASGQKRKSNAAEAEAGDGLLNRLGELGWQALPAIGSAIGFAGFVAVIGAAIEWIRFDAAHLPATQAVLAVPRQELVIIGALALAAFVAGGVLAVLLVYLIDNNGNATTGTVWGIVAVGVVEMLITLFFINVAHWWIYPLLIAWLLIIGFAAGDVAANVMRNFRSRTKLTRARAKVIEARDKLAAASDAADATGTADREIHDEATAKAREQAQLALLAAQREWERAIREWNAQAGEIVAELREDAHDRLEGVRKEISAYGSKAPSADELERSLNEAERDTGHVFRAVGARLRAQVSAFGDTFAGRPLLVLVMLALFVLTSTIVGIVLVATEGAFSWLVIVLGIVAVLTTMNLLVARATAKFAWYGVSVFFSVLLFGATLTIARTLDKPSVQPIALVRKSNDVGICGVYIAQTSDRVYVGRLSLEGRRPGLIFWVPTSDVDLVSVGQPERINQSFPKLAVAMLAQLYKDRAEEAAPTLKNTTVTETKGGASSSRQTTTARETPPSTVRPVRRPEESVGKTCTEAPATRAPAHVDP